MHVIIMSFCLLGTHRFTGCDMQNLTVEHILLQPAPLNLAPYRNRELILNVIHTENKVSSSLMNSPAAKSWGTCQRWYTLWLNTICVLREMSLKHNGSFTWFYLHTLPNCEGWQCVHGVPTSSCLAGIGQRGSSEDSFSGNHPGFLNSYYSCMF